MYQMMPPASLHSLPAGLLDPIRDPRLLEEGISQPNLRRKKGQGKEFKLAAHPFGTWQPVAAVALRNRVHHRTVFRTEHLAT
jgi:hypothetical protein